MPLSKSCHSSRHKGRMEHLDVCFVTIVTKSAGQVLAAVAVAAVAVAVSEDKIKISPLSGLILIL